MNLLKKLQILKIILNGYNEVRYQSDFLYNQDGELAVDYVGRLETIEEDFNFLCNKFNLNASLPHINRSQHKKYLELCDD